MSNRKEGRKWRENTNQKSPEDFQRKREKMYEKNSSPGRRGSATVVATPEGWVPHALKMSMIFSKELCAVGLYLEDRETLAGDALGVSGFIPTHTPPAHPPVYPPTGP